MRKPLFDPVSQPWEANPGGLAAVPAAQLTADALRARFGAPPAWQPESREVVSPPVDAAPREAAVLVPMMLRPEGITVMLTQRTAHLHDHAGQVSFPGGRVENDDASASAAALREAQEETGLPADRVELLGSLPHYPTSTGFVVSPIVGLVRPDFTLAPDPFEVAEVFEVPLAFLMDPANHRLHRAVLPSGAVRNYFSMPWREFFIWGATAGMLRNLYQFLRA